MWSQLRSDSDLYTRTGEVQVGLAPTRTMVQTEAADEGESGSASGKEEASKEVKAMLVTVVSAAYAQSVATPT